MHGVKIPRFTVPDLTISIVKFHYHQLHPTSHCIPPLTAPHLSLHPTSHCIPPLTAPFTCLLVLPKSSETSFDPHHPAPSHSPPTHRFTPSFSRGSMQPCRGPCHEGLQHAGLGEISLGSFNLDLDVRIGLEETQSPFRTCLHLRRGWRSK